MAVASVSLPAVLLSCLLVTTQASPIISLVAKQTANNSTLQSLPGIVPVRTTVTKSGDVLDWIKIADQGKIADPPPFSPFADAATKPSTFNRFSGFSSSSSSTTTKDDDNTLEPASDSLKRRDLIARAYGNTNPLKPRASGQSTGQELGIVPVLRFKKGFKPQKRAPREIKDIKQDIAKASASKIAIAANLLPTAKSSSGQNSTQNAKATGSQASSSARATQDSSQNSQQSDDDDNNDDKSVSDNRSADSKDNKKDSKGKKNQKRGYAGEHWYVTSNYGTVVKGAKAIFSLFKPFVRPEDFSLLQMAVGRTGLNSGLQTVEAGYQYYPAFKNITRIFTFYTTNGYASQADNVGGYDQTVKGWVQSSSNYYPGIAVSNYSTFGGAAQELQLQYLLYNGNWWLWIQNEWAGYYPGSLFSAGQSNAAATLASQGDQVFFYGEIAQGGDPLTNTDMGSGKSATLGNKQAAYIRSMQYAGSNSQYVAYPAQATDFYDSDASRYNHSFTTAGASNWGSYVYLGGAGAGGVVGN